MTLIIEEGKVINGNIVLSNPLSLPEGTEVRVKIEPVEPVPVNEDDSQILVPMSLKTLLTCPASGCGRIGRICATVSHGCARRERSGNSD